MEKLPSRWERAKKDTTGFKGLTRQVITLIASVIGVFIVVRLFDVKQGGVEVALTLGGGAAAFFLVPLAELAWNYLMTAPVRIRDDRIEALEKNAVDREAELDDINSTVSRFAMKVESKPKSKTTFPQAQVAQGIALAECSKFMKELRSAHTEAEIADIYDRVREWEGRTYDDLDEYHSMWGSTFGFGEFDNIFPTDGKQIMAVLDQKDAALMRMTQAL